MQVRPVVSIAYLALTLLFGLSAAHAQYRVTNLVSNQAGIAGVTDPRLANAWGLAIRPGGDWWISDANSGWSTAYNYRGVIEVNSGLLIPAASGSGPGSPTGIVYNGSTSDFRINGAYTRFLFDTLDGTISGGTPVMDDYTDIVVVTNPGASYTGLAISSNPSGNVLFAADNRNNKVDIYDGAFNFVSSFTDTRLPAGFAPFGIQDFGGKVYVTFASTSGAGGGFIDIFSESGRLLRRLTNDPHLNQPWGLAIAPRDFGPFSNTLLVSNNTSSGTINAFNPVTGRFVGTMMNTNNEEIQLNGLWGIAFGDGLGQPDLPDNGATNQLFFAAGPDNPNLPSLFGVITFGNTTSTPAILVGTETGYEFTPAGGTYTTPQTVSITDAFPAVIYYTTNGSTPTTASTVYSEPITVSASETVQAVALASGDSLSAVARARFTIIPPTSTPAR